MFKMLCTPMEKNPRGQSNPNNLRWDPLKLLNGLKENNEATAVILCKEHDGWLLLCSQGSPHWSHCHMTTKVVFMKCKTGMWIENHVPNKPSRARSELSSLECWQKKEQHSLYGLLFHLSICTWAEEGPRILSTCPTVYQLFLCVRLLACMPLPTAVEAAQLSPPGSLCNWDQRSCAGLTVPLLSQLSRIGPNISQNVLGNPTWKKSYQQKILPHNRRQSQTQQPKACNKCVIVKLQCHDNY